MDPLKVKEVVLTDSGTRAAALKLVLKDINAYGLKDSKVEKIT